MDSRFLTKPNPELEEMRRITVPGMAHWAGSDPGRRTCGKCEHYGYEYDRGDGSTRRKHSLCAMYFKLMHKHGERAIPENTPACHYFEKIKEKRGRK
jgi:hypothetical protein